MFEHPTLRRVFKKQKLYGAWVFFNETVMLK